MWELLGTLYMLTFFALVGFAWVSTSTANSLLSFLMLVVLSCVMLYKSIAELMPFLQFLVYVGGLLVLLIYMVMLSTNILFLKNQKAKVFSCVVPVWLFLLIFRPPLNVAGQGGLLLGFDIHVLVLLGLLLTFVFLYVCMVIAVGGRTMKIGKNT